MRSKRLLFLLGFALFVTGLNAQAQSAQIVTFRCDDIMYSRNDFEDANRLKAAKITDSCLIRKNETSAMRGEIPVRVKGKGVSKIYIYFDLANKQVYTASAESRMFGEMRQIDFIKRRSRTSNRYASGPEKTGDKYAVHGVFEVSPTGDNRRFNEQINAHCKVEFYYGSQCPSGTEKLRWVDLSHDPVIQELNQRSDRISGRQQYSSTPSRTYQLPRRSGVRSNGIQ